MASLMASLMMTYICLVFEPISSCIYIICIKESNNLLYVYKSSDHNIKYLLYKHCKIISIIFNADVICSGVKYGSILEKTVNFYKYRYYC